jgi:hypothetical protein
MGNLVQMPPGRVVLSLQYWAGDEARALRLVRLLADIEPRRREDVYLAFCRRHDLEEESAAAYQARLHCGFKFGVMALRSPRPGAGHPHGCNELWAGIMDELARAWSGGLLDAHSVFFLEADAVPLRADWLDRILGDHARTLAAGKRVTGPIMNRLPHINGALAAHLSLWLDRPSLHQTPPEQAWDLFHAETLLAEARPTAWIKNIYGACRWSPESLVAMSGETAWICSQKDDSAFEWAARTLVTGRAPQAHQPCLHLTDGQACMAMGCACPCNLCAGARGDEPKEARPWEETM